MLQKLEVHALRGATKPLELTFEKGKKVTIIYGDNGSGKTTICDAFELLGSGKLRSLDDKGLGRTERYWHSTGQTAAHLRVALKTSNGSWSAKVVQSKAIVSPQDTRPLIKVLRRETLLQLIAREPSGRFEVVRPFLDVDDVEKSEVSLKELLTDLGRSRDEAAARIDEIRVQVEQFWNQAGRPGTDALGWARVEAKKDTAELTKEISQGEQLIARVDRVESQSARVRTATEMLQATEAFHRQSSEALATEQGKAAGTLGNAVRILQAAKQYFEAEQDPKACPLCTSAERVQDLPARVDDQLRRMAALTAAIEQEAEARRKLGVATDRVRTDLEELRAAFEELRGSLAGSGPGIVTVPTSDVVEALVKATGVGHAEEDLAQAAETLAPRLAVYRAALASDLDKRREQKGFLQALKLAIGTYDSKYADRRDLDVLVPIVQSTFEEVQQERHAFVNEILGAIASRVGELYEQIHPGEGLSKIKLLLLSGKKGSLDIQAAFPGVQEAPPGAYFSTSHLDSLGLCIFIALAELEDAKNTTLVLDDVIASFDEPHVDRLVEVLYETAEKFEHCVCTTHYRPWREKYRWGLLKSGECHFIELMPWEYASGVRLGKLVLPVQELRDLLAAAQPSPQQVSASAGVILEAVLDFLTLLYECRMPRRKGRWTLGDLLPAVGKKLRTALKVERASSTGQPPYTEQKLGGILDELEKIAQARNIFGAHFNDLAGHIPPKDAIRFAELVLQLADQLIDQDHGWPKSDKSGSYWANSGQTRRLYPLKQPT